MQISTEPKKNVFYETCLQNGLKITHQRTLIYEELTKAKDHPSVDIIYKRVRKLLPNISFDTVFRTLETFSVLGIIKQVEGSGELKRFDPDLENHHHMHCIRCKKIIDFSNATYDALKIPPGLEKDFKILNKRVVLEGLCKDCSGK
jgi:Fur family transcriptional regulator, peroxide stress response regulator